MKRHSFLILLLIAPYSALGENSVEVSRRYFAMGTMLDVELRSTSRQQSLEAADAAWKTVSLDEQRLSTWRQDSELSEVNRSAPGQVARLSPLLRRDLENALHCAVKTDYAFTPWIGPLVKAWGLRHGGKIPSVQERTLALKASQPEAFTFGTEGITRNYPESNIEEGGFGKGVALDDALSALAARGVRSAVLNFGGQIAIQGEQEVPVEVADPSNREKTLLSFVASQGSISTSSNSVHGLKITANGKNIRIGHLLDPRTGEPASYEGSVTVIADSGANADCFSKIFVLGAAQGLKWAKKNHVQALWLVPSRIQGHWIARASCDWKPALVPLTSQVKFRPDCKKGTS